MNGISADLPEDIRISILLRADYATIMAMCLVDKEYNVICQNWYFWFKKMQTIRPAFNPNQLLFPLDRLKKLYQSLEGTGSVYSSYNCGGELHSLNTSDNLASVDAAMNGPNAALGVNILFCMDQLGKVREIMPLTNDVFIDDSFSRIVPVSNIVQVTSSTSFAAFLDDQGDVYVGKALNTTIAAPQKNPSINKYCVYKQFSQRTFCCR